MQEEGLNLHVWKNGEHVFVSVPQWVSWRREQWSPGEDGVSEGTRVEHETTQGQFIIRRQLKGQVAKCL